MRSKSILVVAVLLLSYVSNTLAVTPSFQGLGDLSGGNYMSEAWNISADGSVIVGSSYYDLTHEAFRWEDGIMTGLGDLPGGNFASEAHSVSADGSVIVGSCDSGSFIWDADNGMRNLKTILENDYSLDLTGWTLNSAENISNDGLTIVGWSYNPDGYIEGWVATTPEPCTLLLFGLVAVMMRKTR